MRSCYFYGHTLKFYRDCWMPGFSWRHVLALTEKYEARGVPRWIVMNCLALLAVIPAVVLPVVLSGCSSPRELIQKMAPTAAPTSAPSPQAIQVDESEPDPTQEVQTLAVMRCAVSTDGLHMRVGPGAGWNVVGWLVRGQEVTIEEEINGWGLASVVGASDMGWINLDYVECEQ
jgi:hypothetical protein